MPTIPGMNNIDWLGAFSQVFYWLGWILVGLVVVGVIFGVAYLLSFPYKISYWPLYGSGQKGAFAFDKPKTNRARKNKEGTSWILMWPLLKTKEIDVFDSEYIYPGKNCYAFNLNGVFIPARITMEETEKEFRGKVSPVPTYIRNWQSLQHKKNAIEFAKNTWWDDNKAYVYGLITVGLCLAACGLTVYLTYKFAGPKSADMANLANALQNFATVK